MEHSKYVALERRRTDFTFLFLILYTVHLVDTGSVIGRISPERYLQGGQELIHPCQKRLGPYAGALMICEFQDNAVAVRCGSGRHGRPALEYNDPVGEIRGHDEIVLNHEGGLFRVQDESEVMSSVWSDFWESYDKSLPLDDLAGYYTLLRVEETGGSILT
jgi:hypothetical protein